METTTDILNELKLLSPLIAEINKVNVFTVPPGYFSTISETVLACIQEENAPINQPAKISPADIPAGYFDHLADSILNKIKVAETAAGEIMSLSPLLYAIQNKNVFEVPDGYFDQLTGLIFDNISNENPKKELKEISPLLYSMHHKELFEVPGEYFTNLPGDILKKVHAPIAKVVSMRKRSLFVKYAIAAMMTGVLALGLYKYIDKPVSGLHDDTTIATLDASIEKGKSMNDTQFNEALGKLTDGDIAKYLENNGDIADVAVLRNSLEDVSLPSQEDYLLDETTLDNYLKEIEKTTLNN